MNIKSNILIFSLLILTFVSCKKDEDIIFEEAQVEIDWASYIAKTSGYPFTLFSRVPTEPGRAVYNTGNAYGVVDPLLLRTRAITDTIKMRINLVGKQQPTAQNFEVRVASTYTTAIEGTTNGTGVHFQLLDRTVTIPANSSFGFCRWVVRNPGVTNNIPVTVVFQLLGNEQTKVNQNYQYIGWSIDQL